MSVHELINDPRQFSLDAYERAIDSGRDIATAIKELDKCIKKPAELARVYNGNCVDVNRTALFVTLRPSTQDEETDKATKQLLEHPVLREVIDLKWKNFGQRMYMEQVMVYLLLLLTLTITASMRPNTENVTYPIQLHAWFYVGAPLVIAIAMCPWFQYDHRLRWASLTILSIAIVIIAVHYIMQLIDVNYHYFFQFNNVVLAMTSFYFLRFELNELFGEVAEHNRLFDCGIHSMSLRWQKILYYCVFCPFSVVYQFIVMLLGGDGAKYFDSYFNRIQLPTFAALMIFVVREFVSPYDHSIRLYYTIALTTLLYILGLQYLEVHGTAGYLIPMMRRLLHDLYRFLAFYWPFQCAYACAYFLLFQESDEASYNTLWHSFVTTFLVMLGQIDLDPFENLPNTASYVMGYVLLLTHATIVIVMLLNVLIAIMTETVDGGLDQAKVEALVSFAECVLRSEKTVGLTPISADGPADRIKLLEQEVDARMTDLGFTTVDEITPSTSERLDKIESTLSQVLLLLNEIKKNK
ncbi:hypothetical protein THRCLA_03362 [Thraustotheca clavata]|uniref:Ion transport domain-containing protein n=1 Tax=Thraustotheca clavata TaxID=74557 RepID=A0A1W0A2A0_9STRA|nr:hypothetical protein THRCLA_03362 [Thraustotheca clavata]